MSDFVWREKATELRRALPEEYVESFDEVVQSLVELQAQVEQLKKPPVFHDVDEFYQDEAAIKGEDS